MTYELEFLDEALKEWSKLDQPIKEQFRKQLVKRLENKDMVYRLAQTRASKGKD